MRRFSNRQVTAMVVAVCMAIALAPVGVMAAVDQVRVTDGAQAGDLARVDDGKLRVGDGKGPVSVDGRVAADSRMSVAAQPFHVDSALAPPFDDLPVAEKHGPGRLALTSVVAAGGSGTIGHTRITLTSFVINDPSWDCNVSSGELPPGSVPGVDIRLSVPAGDTVSVAWPSPVVLFEEAEAGTTSCLWVFQGSIGGDNRHTDFTIDGFWLGG